MDPMRLKAASSVFAIAPHLLPRARNRSRRRTHRFFLSTLGNDILMESSGYESDPLLSDDSRVGRGAQRDKEEEKDRALLARVGRDGQGEIVLRRVSGRTDDSDTSSSFCTCLKPHLTYGHNKLISRL
jgi:hypothetical protein